MHQLLQMATPGVDQPQDQLQGGPADMIREAAPRQLARAAAATEEVATSSSQDGYDTQVKYNFDNRSYITF